VSREEGEEGEEEEEEEEEVVLLLSPSSLLIIPKKLPNAFTTLPPFSPSIPIIPPFSNIPLPSSSLYEHKYPNFANIPTPIHAII
jgi:hypothetical protein